MAPAPSAERAREQLAAVVAEGSALELPANLPPSERPRAAAVLILFGVLDRVPSEREASGDPEASVSHDLDVLLLARATTLRAHAGQIAFPGGRMDAGDAGPIAAALREAEEETGLDPGGVAVLGALPDVPLARSGHLVTPVIGWWERPSAVRVVDEAESAAVFRVPVADLLDPRNRGVTVLRRGGQEWRGPGFLVRAGGAERLVWGFTAMLLDGLFTRVGWTESWDQARELPLDGWV